MKDLLQLISVLLLLLSPVLLAACLVACATGGSYDGPGQQGERFAHLEPPAHGAPGQLSLVTDEQSGTLSFPQPRGALSMIDPGSRRSR